MFHHALSRMPCCSTLEAVGIAVSFLQRKGPTLPSLCCAAASTLVLNVHSRFCVSHYDILDYIYIYYVAYLVSCDLSMFVTFLDCWLYDDCIWLYMIVYDSKLLGAWKRIHARLNGTARANGFQPWLLVVHGVNSRLRAQRSWRSSGYMVRTWIYRLTRCDTMVDMFHGALLCPKIPRAFLELSLHELQYFCCCTFIFLCWWTDCERTCTQCHMT